MSSGESFQASHAEMSLCVCLCVEPPPDITVPYNVTASPGSTAFLTCVVVSTVRFNLTWQRGGVDVRLGTRSRLTSNLSLEIQRVTTDDAGWYSCIAINEGGVSSSRVYLIVQCKYTVHTATEASIVQRAKELARKLLHSSTLPQMQ